MRARIVSTAVVLAVIMAGMTSAQRIGQQTKDQQSERARLRAQMIKLRVDVELLELDRDAQRAHLIDIIKHMLEYETKSPEQVRGGMEMYMNLLSEQGRRHREAREEALKKKLNDAPPEESDRILDETKRELVEASRRDIDETLKKQFVDARAIIDRKKRDFARLEAELAEKRLDLADVEQRYSAIRWTR